MLFLEQLVVIRTLAEQLRATTRAALILTGDTLAMGDLATTLRTDAEAALAHFMSSFHCHKSHPSNIIRKHIYLIA